MKRLRLITLALVTVLLSNCGTNTEKTPVVSTSGVVKKTTKINVGSDGMTTEQRNITKRYKVDNEIGSTKHLYVISSMSGQVLIYSTVDGKVTSGGKRLTSTSILTRGDRGQNYGDFVMPRIQDDGTYGTSMNYLYWFDVNGVYHQHYVTGGQIVHISEQPLPVKEIIINLGGK